MWRQRMQDLSRGVGRPHPPLLAPLLFGVASQIEAIDPDLMALDGTRLRKNVAELRRMLGTDAVFCSAPHASLAAALGVRGSDPAADRLAADVRIKASLEAVRQWQADTSEPVIIAAFQGPSTLAAALRRDPADLDAESLYEHLGRGLAALVRLFAETGVQVVQFHEEVAPPEDQIDLWKDALGTAGNVARFHRVAPVLVVQDPAFKTWPAQMVACPGATQRSGALLRPHGHAIGGNPREWPESLTAGPLERLVTSAVEVSPSLELPELISLISRLKGS